MRGNPKIGTMMKALNFVVQPFVDVINKLVQNNDREWVVRVEDGNADQDSYFVASDSQVALVIRRASLISPDSEDFRVTLVQAGEEVEADINGRIRDDA